MATEVAPSIDMDTLQGVVGQLVSDYNAAMASALVYIGDRNGLFVALDGAGAVTPEELAATTGQSSRYLLEWLSAMACSGYVQYNPATGRFTLPPEQAFCLANADSPVFFSGLFEMLPTWYGNAPKVAEAFKDGKGVPQQEYGEEFWHGFERFTRAQFLNHLTQHWIPEIPGLEAKLEAGARVADIGCGNGQAILILAGAYPNSQFIGYDNYPLAVENARQRAVEAGVAGRVRYELADIVQGISGRYDLITIFDTVHDMVDPVGALTAIRKALAPDGVLLWTEFNVSGDLAENLDNPINLAKFTYSASTLYCMTTSLSQGGAGIGTCMGPHKAEELAQDAGFGSFRRLPIDDPFTALYEVRP
ncbi:MAG TPA: methyltransferase domain-containing protein [Chloroflexota bacterium]|nr:methyltransferase domain-containing protein [Chloroflexota bacterium]